MKPIEYYSAYLPYGVEFKGHRKGWANPDSSIMTLCRVDLDGRFKEIKLILRPLEELTDDDWSEIAKELKGNENEEEFTGEMIKNYVFFYKEKNAIPYWIVRELLKRHIDLWNLIDQGKAIKK